MGRKAQKNDSLPGSLDMLILRTLSRRDLHGYGIVQFIQQSSDNELLVEEGSLYPALQRLELNGWIDGVWGVTSNNRRARIYKITAAGRKQLAVETRQVRQTHVGDRARDGSGVTDVLRRLRYWIESARRSEALREEMELHLAEKAAELQADGMTAECARAEARRRFGNVGLKHEESREIWMTRFLSELGQDVRYGCRTMAANKAFSALAVLSLALGIGANTAIYSLMESILLRSLPVADPESLVVLNWHSRPPQDGTRNGSTSCTGYKAFSGRATKAPWSAGCSRTARSRRFARRIPSFPRSSDTSTDETVPWPSAGRPRAPARSTSPASIFAAWQCRRPRDV